MKTLVQLIYEKTGCMIKDYYEIRMIKSTGDLKGEYISKENAKILESDGRSSGARLKTSEWATVRARDAGYVF